MTSALLTAYMVEVSSTPPGPIAPLDLRSTYAHMYMLITYLPYAVTSTA